ncbi:MAG: hypothetical protein KTR16_05590 [Acidiferrobacterales bacterium]|nr:hypothetical protein [Acidiferrobacterales bacterium]
MQKYAITLLVLTLIGIGLTVFLFTQDEKLDQTVFLETTESIRNLQTLDKNLLILLTQSRFNSDFDHEVLLDTSYELSEEFSNLRFDALFEEIEASPELSQAVEEFDQNYASREEELEIYVEANKLVTDALTTVRSSGNDIVAIDLNGETAAIKPIVAQTKAEILSLALGEDDANNAQLQELLAQLDALLPKESSEALLAVTNLYKNSVNQVLDNNSIADESFNKLTSLDTGPLLDNIENEYVNYHNRGIQSSNTLRNALIIYGVLLLLALLFFAKQIRRNYLFLEQEVADRTEEIKTTLEELQESQEQLIQSEKMASLGQMVAGVAHEINTPLGYVSSNVETLRYNIGDISDVMDELGEVMKQVSAPNRDNNVIKQQLLKTLKKYQEVEAEELAEETKQLLSDGAYGLTEISKLVVSLKDFARLDRQSVEEVNIHDCIESSLTIASNHIRENNVEVIRNFAELPLISCIPSKLNQLFLNVITNACQAMSETGGALTVETAVEGENVRLSFTDQGVGMDDETKQKMFDPFFTSKEIGVGTGLGMSIAYKIIQAHNGTISVDSELGKGTALTITLPTA